MSQTPFRHSFLELRAITTFPLGEVVVLGDTPPISRLRELLVGSELVARLEKERSDATRLVVVGGGPHRLVTHPPSATCVVLDVGELVDPAHLPLPGMCLRTRLELQPDGGLLARLQPEATTVPEALELIAELFFGLGIQMQQQLA